MRPNAPTHIAFLLLGIAAIPQSRAEPRARVDFEKEIKPILQDACVQCHGPDKQKGKLRLDTKEGWIKGGDNGPVFTPGDPTKSDLVQRIKLPEDHDDVMPPKGKADHLTAAQAETISRWIAEGAEWPEGITAKATPLGGGSGDETERTGPPATPPELRTIAELAKRGIKVVPIASGLNWRRADLRPLGEKVTHADIVLLSRLGVLRELNLGGTAIHDCDLEPVASLPNLTVLHLENTAITDAGVPHLVRLKKLTYLNLFGTAVSDASADSLAKLSRLKSLYLAGTKMTKAGVATLQQRLPEMAIEFGAEFAQIAVPDPIPPKVSATPKPATPSTPAPAAKAAAPNPATTKP